MQYSFIDLTLALVITSNVIISCQSASGHFFRKSEVHARKMSPFSKSDLPEIGEDYMKRSKRVNLLQKWSIPAIHVQLDIAIDRYHFLNQTMQDLYFGVSNHFLYSPTIVRRTQMASRHWPIRIATRPSSCQTTPRIRSSPNAHSSRPDPEPLPNPNWSRRNLHGLTKGRVI